MSVIQNGKDTGYIVMPLPRQLVEDPVTATTAEQIEVVQSPVPAIITQACTFQMR